MPICHKRKIAFCHVPRAGGVSICASLGLIAEDKHMPVSWIKNQYPGYKTFSVYRPYRDRISSSLGWKVPEARKPFDGNFDDLVDMLVIRKRLPPNEKRSGIMLYPNEYFLDDSVDFLLQFCDLENELNKMLNQLSLPEIKLIKSNSFRNEKGKETN